MGTDYLAQLVEQPLPESEPAGADIDDLLHLKSRILRTKLEVLASEIYTRLNLWDRNIGRISDGTTRIQVLINRFTQQANYHLRDRKDANVLYQRIFDLETQRRSEDVECWRDIVDVLKDFLAAWEAHEHAKARAIFFNNAGRGIETYV